MTGTPVSKPILALLLATIVASMLTLLTPQAPGDSSDSSDLVIDRTSSKADKTSPVSRQRPTLRRPVTPTDISATPPLSGFTPPRPAPTPTPPVPTAIPQPIAIEQSPSTTFTYLGRFTEDQRTLVFLQSGGDAIAVAAGDSIDSNWKLDAIQPDGLLIRHLPSQKISMLRTSP